MKELMNRAASGAGKGKKCIGKLNFNDIYICSYLRSKKAIDKKVSFFYKLQLHL